MPSNQTSNGPVTLAEMKAIIERAKADGRIRIIPQPKLKPHSRIIKNPKTR